MNQEVRKHLPTIRAVAFDLDGTLYPYQTMMLSSSCLVIQHPRFFYHLVSVRKQLRKIRPIFNFYTLQADLLARSMNISVARASALLHDILYQDWPAVLQTVFPFSGVKNFIHDLHKHHIRTAILSDFPIQRKLAHLGLENGWTALICSEDVGYLKPSPEPFLELIQHLGCAPEEILYIGDNYYYDMVGAHNAGLHCGYLRLFPTHRSLAVTPLIQFSHYHQLHNWCKKTLAIL